MPLSTVGRIANALLAFVALIAGTLVATHPAGLSPDLLSWLAWGELVAIGGLALLPGVLTGTITAGDVRRVIAEAPVVAVERAETVTAAVPVTPPIPPPAVPPAT